MITKYKTGRYTIAKAESGIDTLHLEDESFTWLHPRTIGGVLVTSHRRNEDDTIISGGRYLLYQIDDELLFPNLWHLELETDSYSWNGYTLPDGLPDETHQRKQITPSNQVISGSKLRRTRYFLQHIPHLLPVLPVPSLRFMKGIEV